jgi:hypothetical protein
LCANTKRRATDRVGKWKPYFGDCNPGDKSHSPYGRRFQPAAPCGSGVSLDSGRNALSFPAHHSNHYAPLRSHNDILTYQRFTDTEHLTVALNLTDEARRLNCADGNVVFSTHLDRQDLRIVGSLLLRPDQGVIIRTPQSSL